MPDSSSKQTREPCVAVQHSFLSSSNQYRLNGICPYFTMFPLSFPLTALGELFAVSAVDGVFGTDGQADPLSKVPTFFRATGAFSPDESGRGWLEPWIRRRGWVLDPFCGRGTTNLASRILGIPSVGIDISPVAVAIAASKIVGPTPEEIVAEAERILRSYGEPREVPEGEFWELAYHLEVLRSLCKLREALMDDCSSPARIALRGIVLGALHGPLTKGVPSYFSNQAPRTFAPKPRYSVLFWRRHGLFPPLVDVLQVIRLRAQRYYSQRLPITEAVIIRHDSGDDGIAKILEDFRGRMGRPCLAVVTSPPYYGMSTYIPDQWIRNWFLGGSASVDYKANGQLGRGSYAEYVQKLAIAWKNASSVCEEGARMVVRFGCIGSAPVDPAATLEESLAGTGWVILKIQNAGTPGRGKRQAEAFSCAGTRTANEIDAYCVYRGTSVQ